MASLVVDERSALSKVDPPSIRGRNEFMRWTEKEAFSPEVKLLEHITKPAPRRQLASLSRCIGFSAAPNSHGRRGDVSDFEGARRLHVVSTSLLRDRLSTDAHALGLERARSWGRLLPDATSVVLRDRRSRSFQMLTAGDVRVVAGLCCDSWQGEISTISPLSAAARREIMEIGCNWSLADLDVIAFAYAPLHNSLEQRVANLKDDTYLVDHCLDDSAICFDTKDHSDWSLVNNQIFLGLLGSAVHPRFEMESVINECSAAGVRFVYFSPRNMRRTKEVASKMGIDVGWNCAISLRPLSSDHDPHRMPSSYADWDVNARLPHGISEIRTHLDTSDNIPLQVSLFTDVTGSTTAEMVRIFQEHSDTVLAVGHTHRLCNEKTFATADLAVGIDILGKELIISNEKEPETNSLSTSKIDSLLPRDIEFISSIGSHSCIFNLKGASSINYFPDIIQKARASLDAAEAAAFFFICASLSFSFLCIFSLCTVSTTVPYIPASGSVLYLVVIIPFITFTMAMTEESADTMKKTPPKNELSLSFPARGEGRRTLRYAIFRSLTPAIYSQVIYLISFGEIMHTQESSLLRSQCSMPQSGYLGTAWIKVIYCDALSDYSGDVRSTAGSLMVAEMAISFILLSSTFLYRTQSIQTVHPWTKNKAWLTGVPICILTVIAFLGLHVGKNELYSLPWYFFLLMCIFPFINLVLDEVVKKSDSWHVNRAVMYRRLQFDTRLGQWSPK